VSGSCVSLVYLVVLEEILSVAYVLYIGPTSTLSRRAASPMKLSRRVYSQYHQFFRDPDFLFTKFRRPTVPNGNEMSFRGIPRNASE
jgi:hypothetical protein